MQGAYYAAYWNNAKKPRSLKKVIKDIYHQDTEAKDKPKPDIELFEQRARRLSNGR
jgi:hypothetical protein